MNRSIARRITGAAVIVAGLSFGASQLMASPRSATEYFCYGGGQPDCIDEYGAVGKMVPATEGMPPWCQACLILP